MASPEGRNTAGDDGSVVDGELNPTEADDKLRSLVSRAAEVRPLQSD